MNNQERTWKQHFRKIPPRVLDSVRMFPGDACVVACLRKITRQELQDGVFAHLHMKWNEDQVSFPETIIPDWGNGSYSKANLEGKVIVLKDLPMVRKTYSMDTPNYGDWSNGSHEVSFDRDVYQRRYIPPRELGIKISQVAFDPGADAIVFRFTVDEVLDRSASDFHERLLFNINLLQENVGNHDVFEADASLDDYLKTLYVNWELLPPGEREDNLAKIFRTVKSDDLRIRGEITARYDFLERLKPTQIIRGTNGFRNYFGAQFAPDLVVFENVEYGNAIYIMFEDWDMLSQLSRTELLAQHPDRIVRIPHTAGWRRRLSIRVRKELQERKRR